MGMRQEALEGHTDDVVEPDKAATAAAPPESGDDLDSFPDNYFGTNVREYAEENGVEAAKAFYTGLQDANRVANKRLEEIAELRKQASQQQAPPQAEAQTPAEEMSDEEVLQLAGINPELLKYEDVGKPMVDLIRRQLHLESQMEGVAQATEADKWQRQFDTRLNSLEGEHGQLPYDRETVESFAVERNIYDPDALYWAIMGPIQRQAASHVLRRTEAVDQTRRDFKRAVTGPRAKTAPAGATAPGKPKTLKEAFEAAKQEQNVPAGFDPFAFEE